MVKKVSLNGHKLEKGVFVTPMNSIKFLQPCSWFTERLPEYLWLGLILNSFYMRKEGLQRIMQMLYRISYASNVWPFPTMSGLLTLDENLQRSIFQVIVDSELRTVLSPLTLLYTYSEYPIFSSYFSKDDVDFEESLTILEKVIRKMGDNQSNFATDVKFCIVYYGVVAGKMHFPVDIIKEFSLYPLIEHSDERMRSIRPMIRTSEMTFSQVNHRFMDDFWTKCGAMFECKSFTIPYDRGVSANDAKKFTTFVKNILSYYGDLYRIVNPINDKMLVLLGIATYSYKRFIEIVEHDLYNAISGRAIVRVLIEDFIMMKFLLKEESQKPNVWREYQDYGMGGLKLVTERYSSKGKSLDENSHLDLRFLNALVDVYKNRLLLNMDTRMFGGEGIREKFDAVDEKELYYIYDYDSGFEHGLWGAIRESSLLICDTPGHQYHCIPDVENLQKMRSVWYDAVFLMKKTIKLLINQFGISDELNKMGEEYGM